MTYSAGSDDDTGVREGGFSLGIGYEARIRLDQFVTNAIILAGTLSYERVVDSNSRVLLNNFDPRAKLGYRHVFGPGLGLEIAGELRNRSMSAPATRLPRTSAARWQSS